MIAYKLRDWIYQTRRKASFMMLSHEPTFAEYQESYCFEWSRKPQHPADIDFLAVYALCIEWNGLLIERNSNTKEYLIANQDKICWKWFPKDPDSSSGFLTANPNTISDWCALISNPNARGCLIANLDKIDIESISSYSKIDWSLEVLQLINWKTCLPIAKESFIVKLEEIDWFNASSSRNLLGLLQDNEDKIDWYQFSMNLGPITYDYERMEFTKKDINRDLAKYFRKSKFIRKSIVSGKKVKNYFKRKMRKLI